jgi:uridylate kinase
MSAPETIAEAKKELELGKVYRSSAGTARPAFGTTAARCLLSAEYVIYITYIICL